MQNRERDSLLCSVILHRDLCSTSTQGKDCWPTVPRTGPGKAGVLGTRNAELGVRRKWPRCLLFLLSLLGDEDGQGLDASFSTSEARLSMPVSIFLMRDDALTFFWCFLHMSYPQRLMAFYLFYQGKIELWPQLEVGNSGSWWTHCQIWKTAIILVCDTTCPVLCSHFIFKSRNITTMDRTYSSNSTIIISRPYLAFLFTRNEKTLLARLK